MDKFYVVVRLIKSECFENVQDAIVDAKRRQAADKDNRYVVMESKSISKLPIPNIEMEDFA